MKTRTLAAIGRGLRQVLIVVVPAGTRPATQSPFTSWQEKPVKQIKSVAQCASIAALFVLHSTSAQSMSQELLPGTGGDDTVQLQTALSQCTDRRSPCDLRLGAGVFYTDVLLVEGFHGRITGRGQGRTIIRPLADRALRSTPLPFTDEPTLAQPYPVLFHFAKNSKVSISKLTMEFPAGMTVMPYELPYPGYEGQVITQSLAAAVLVDGDHDAELVMSRVTFVGVDNDTYDGSNLASAARFEGATRYRGGINQTRIMQGGRLVASDNRIQRSGFGIQVLYANRLEGLVTDNTIDARIYAIDFQDLGASSIAVLRNTIDAELAGIAVFQTPELAPKAASGYLIAQNNVRVNETGAALDSEGGYAGISVFDFSAYSDPVVPETFNSDITILNNNIVIANNPVKNGIDVSGDGKGDIRIIGNRISGAPFDSAISVELSAGTFITGNDLRGVDPPNGDVHLTATARNCRVSERGDTVVDEGTNNQVNLAQ